MGAPAIEGAGKVASAAAGTAMATNLRRERLVNLGIIFSLKAMQS